MSETNIRVLWPGWDTVRVIGRGSYGTVYEIEKKDFGKISKAALKVITIPQNESEIDDLLSDGNTKESITIRFKGYLESIVNEYSTMSDMKGCTNIVYCDDVQYIQHDDGMGWDIYIKMELLKPLTKVVTEPIDEERVIKIGIDLCRALVYCSDEKRNILHRDIKPQNIFVAPDGTIKLGDFGIAKTVESTAVGTKTGTYKYMAPEVNNNQPYGRKADIYSLGLVLYWLLNERRLPFLPLPPKPTTYSEENDSLKRRFGGEPLPPPAHGSAKLKRIVLKACAYDPKDRYATAAEMLRDLEGLKDKQEDELPFIPLEPVPKPRPDTGLTDDDDPTIGAFGDHTDTKDNNDPIDQEDPSSLTDGPFGHDPADQPAKDDDPLQRRAAYEAACELEAAAKTADEFYAVAAAFECPSLQGYFDSAERSRKCRDRAASLNREQEVAGNVPAGGDKKKKSPLYMIIGLVAVVALVLCVLVPRAVMSAKNGGETLSAHTEKPTLTSAPTPARTSAPKPEPTPAPAPARTPMPTPTLVPESDFSYKFNSDGRTVSITGYKGDKKVISIPSSIDGHKVTSIGANTFYNCNLTNLTIPDSVTSIGAWAFYNCSNLTSVTIPSSITSIGNSSFAYCSGLTGMTIPSSVTIIGDRAFEGCNRLTHLTILGGITSIGDAAFSGCSKLTSITIPSSVTSIGDSAFAGCSRLESVTIPDSVTSIGDRAFYGCGVKSLIIPESVTSIGSMACLNCSSLTSVTIPSSVTSIGMSAFHGCFNLADIYYSGTREEWTKISIASGNTNLTNATIHFNSQT